MNWLIKLFKKLPNYSIGKNTSARQMPTKEDVELRRLIQRQNLTAEEFIFAIERAKNDGR